MSRWISPWWLVLASPLLQGAGCRAHYTPNVKGQLQTDEGLRYAHSGHKALIVYKKHEAPCDDWGKCLQAPGWQPLTACPKDMDPDAPGGDVPEVVVSEGAVSSKFDACTAMLGVDYKVDVAAFIDLNEDGKPSSGEPYGAFLDGPLERSLEEAGVIIRIGEKLP